LTRSVKNQSTCTQQRPANLKRQHTMKNTDPEITAQTTCLPTRITRRSFVKRTAATIIATSLALHAFRAEAVAAAAGGSSLCVQIGSFPDWATDNAIGKAFVSKSSVAKFLTGGSVDGYKLEARIEMTPGSAKVPYKQQLWDLGFKCIAVLSKPTSTGWKEICFSTMASPAIRWWVGDDAQPRSLHTPKPFASPDAGSDENSFKHTQQVQDVSGPWLGSMTIQGTMNTDNTGVEDVVATWEDTSTSTDGIKAVFGFIVTNS